MGKHNAPRKPITPTLVRAGAFALALSGPIALNTSSAYATPASSSILEVIAKCESGNRNINHNTALSGIQSTASGYLQIIDSTWRAYGGTQFASRAIHASREEQFIVGARILAGQGISAWNPSRSCWGSKISTTRPKTIITPEPKEFKVAPPKKITPKTEVKKIRPPTPPTSTKKAAKKVAQSYLIHRGDTLTKIARKHRTTVKRLAALNSDTVKNPDLIYAGKRLRLG